MLNIKLPKGKMARALVACADAYAASAVAENIAYYKDLNVWHRDMTFICEHGGPAVYPPPTPSLTNKDKALKFMEMAAACTHSTGDVYASAELWAEIKGYYYE